MGRFRRSWELVKLCWGVLKQDKELIVFPIVSGIGVFIVTLSFAIPAGLLAYGQDSGDLSGSLATPISYAGLFLFYFVMYLVIIFCNSALVSAAMIRIKGGDPTLRDGYRGAMSHLGAILGYAAISATVGVLLRLIRNQGGIGPAIIAMLGGAAWNIITFLAIPVLVNEGVGPVKAIKRSAVLLKKTWGEQLIGVGGVGLVFGLIGFGVLVVGGGLGVLVIAGAGIVALGVALLVVTFLVLLTLGLIHATLNSVYTAALYEYAVNGDAGLFGQETLAGAFRPRGR